MNQQQKSTPSDSGGGLGQSLGSEFISPSDKLKLLEEPARHAVTLLRTLANDHDLGLSDSSKCSMSNLALWLEGVLDELPGYMPWRSENARKTLDSPNARDQRLPLASGMGDAASLSQQPTK